MIPGMMMPMRGIDNGSSLRETINALGLTSGLKLLLDAGDRASVASASQAKWLDISGNGYDFNRGSGSGSDSGDPTFAGTIGGQSQNEYYHCDLDYFTYDSANETWMNNLHKNNARFTVAMWVNLPNSGANGFLLSTDNGGGPGVYLILDNTHALFVMLNDTVLGYSSENLTIPSGVGWAFVAMSVNEASNSILWNIRGTASSGTCTYSSPSSASASDTMRIGYRAGTAMPTNSGIASYAMWEGTSLTAAQMAALFTATRGKFGV